MPAERRRVAAARPGKHAVERPEVRGQLPLYPDEGDHVAYVAVAELEWPLQGLAYRVVCPAAGCRFLSWAQFRDFPAALSHAQTHRDEWWQAEGPEPTPGS